MAFRLKLALVGLIALWIAFPGLSAPQASSSPDLTKDERLAKKLTLPGDTLPLAQVIKGVHAATGVSLMVQGDLLRRPVAIAVKDKTCAEILENLRVLFGGTWVRRGDSYLLVTDETVAKQMANYPEGTSTVREGQALRRSFTSVQVEALRRNGGVDFQSLSPVQKRLVLTMLRDEYLRDPSRYPSSILTGKDVRLTYPSAPPIVLRRPDLPPGDVMVLHSPEITIHVPVIQDDGSLASWPLVTIPAQ
jgi:hypothetical protein